MVHVHVTDVTIIKVPLEEHIIQRQFPLLEVVNIVYVLVVFIDVVLEIVTDVEDVLHTLTVTI